MRILLQREDTVREESSELVRPDRLPAFRLPPAQGSRRIAIVPGGTKNVLGEQILRRWPIENYVRLATVLLDRGWEIVMVGGRDDDWVRPHFQHLPVNDMIGQLSLPEVLCAFDDCDAVISHDTGPLHLAGLSTCCLIGLFGPTDPATFQPRRAFSLAIWGGHGFACRPCYDGRNFAPCGFNGCMHQISPELVLRELDRLLDLRDRGGICDTTTVYPERDVSNLHRIMPASKS
jgi:heptosyltransferase-2